MSVLEKAKQHFQGIVSGEGLRSIEVPEWGEAGKPAVLYFKPLAALPIKTYSRLISLGSEQTVEAFVDMLILRCVDSEGAPLFKMVDKTEMLRCISPVVVCQIMTRMSESDTVPSVEDAKKNC
jgi:hypothetical protein